MRAASRRSFLRVTAALSGAAALPWTLQGCGRHDGGGAAISKVHVLAASPAGELRRAWTNFNTLTLARDGVLLTYGGSYTQLNGAITAAAAADGSFWIADKGNGRLLHLDGSLRPLGTIAAVAGITLRQPSGIAILPDRRLVVGDVIRGRVAIVDENGANGLWIGIDAAEHFRTGWRPRWESETDPRIMDNPEFVGADSAGAIIVLDTAAGRLLRFTASGEATGAMRLAGFWSGLVVAPDGKVYVCDRQARNVQRIDFSTGQSRMLFSPEQVAQIGGMPRRLAWQSGSGSGIENLIVSFQ